MSPAVIPALAAAPPAVTAATPTPAGCAGGVGDSLRADAERGPAGAGDLAGGDELPGDAGYGVAGDREPDPGRGAAHLRIGGGQRRDADHLPGQVHQGAAAVAGVDRRAGLDGADRVPPSCPGPRRQSARWPRRCRRSRSRSARAGCPWPARSHRPGPRPTGRTTPGAVSWPPPAPGSPPGHQARTRPPRWPPAACRRSRGRPARRRPCRPRGRWSTMSPLASYTTPTRSPRSSRSARPRAAPGPRPARTAAPGKWPRPRMRCPRRAPWRTGAAARLRLRTCPARWTGLALLALVGMADPPRPAVRASIAAGGQGRDPGPDDHRRLRGHRRGGRRQLGIVRRRDRRAPSSVP